MNPLSIEPDFIEEAVFHWVRNQERKGDRGIALRFHREKDKIYESRYGRGLDQNFEQFYQNQFQSLGLRSFFESVIEEFALVVNPGVHKIIRRVWSPKEEGAELYAQNASKMLVIRLRISRLDDMDSLRTYLRYELFHISDVLDPRFAYDSHPDLEGVHEIENDLVRERFRILWDCFIAVRLEMAAPSTLISFEKLSRSFHTAFSFAPKETRERLLEILQRRDQWTQQELIRIAQGKEMLLPFSQETETSMKRE